MVGCNNGSQTGSNTTDSSKQAPAAKAPVSSKLDATGTSLLMSVVHQYYALKNALVATKADQVGTAATELSKLADSLNAFIQKDAGNTALKPYTDTIATESKMITHIKDETCEKQRLSFGTLSRAMYSMLKVVDLKNARVYHEYCPMAFDNTGAYWLSDESEIKNPYFGKKMLECGEVTDSL